MLNDRSLALACVLSLTACAHSDPAEATGPTALDGPHAAASPTRLTFESGMDHVASFTADGATLLYSFQGTDRADRDRCIGLLPAAGGTRREMCDDAVLHRNSTESFEHAAVNDDGALLYGAFTSAIGAPLVSSGELRLATRSTPLTYRSLFTTPNVIGGFSFDHIGTIRWLSATTFLVNAVDQSLIGSPFNEAKLDTLTLGIGLLRGELTATGATFTAVPGTAGLNGFDLSAGRDSIYFTVQDDSSLWAMQVTGSTPRRVYFEASQPGGRMILRDPARVGDRVAVVRQLWQQRTGQPNPPWGMSGLSAIRLVRPADGSSTLFATSPGTSLIFGALAASPTGCRLVAEHRMPQGFTFTTDLYAYCVGTGPECACG